MGTSTSTAGGRSGSPLDPEWLEPAGTGGSGGDSGVADSSGPGEGASEPGEAEGASGPGEPGETQLAPDRRFAGARSSMSAYFRTGDKAYLAGALGGAVRKGMGGAKRAASTMRRTAQGAASIGQVLTGLREQTEPRFLSLVQRFRTEGLSVKDLILEVIKEALPDTGSIDEDSVREAAAEALGEFFEQHPEADLLDLSDEQIQEVMSVTIANDIMHRLDQLLGQTYERLKLDPVQVQKLRNEAKEYVNAVVQVEREKAGKLPANLKGFAATVLQSTLEVFAES